MDARVGQVLADLHEISHEHGYLNLFLEVQDMLYNSPKDDLDRRLKLVHGIVEGIKEVYRLDNEDEI